MNFQSNRYTLRFADSNDDSGIKEIFLSGSFDGGMNIQYLRAPSPYDSFLADGDKANIIVAVDNKIDRIIALGGAVIRHEYVNGVREKCAYMTGLKVHPDYQRKVTFIAKAYSLLKNSISDCRYVYTTVLDDNKDAVALFEKKHKNMPEYRYLGHYTTYCLHGGKKILELEKNNTDGFNDLIEKYFSKQSFVPCDPDYRGFGEKNFFCLRENGKIIASCFVGNQQALKQYKMCGYNGIYRILSKFPTSLIGYPSFPKPDSIINHGVISYLYIKDNDKKLCSDFLRTVASEAGFSLLIWGGFENNPLCKAMDKMKTVHYGSRLYSVVWDKYEEINGTIGVEASLL